MEERVEELDERKRLEISGALWGKQKHDRCLTKLQDKEVGPTRNSLDGRNLGKQNLEGSKTGDKVWGYLEGKPRKEHKGKRD